MAKDIKVLIGGNVQRAEAALRELQRTGGEVANRLERDFALLGTKSSTAFDQQREAAKRAYERIKASGTTTADELVRAEKALGNRLVAIDTEQFGRRQSLLQKFKTNWLATTAIMGAAAAAIYKGFQLAEEAAAGLQKRQAFANLSMARGINADKLLADLKRVSAGTIATQDLIEKAGTSMLLGIEANFLPKLMEIARASSRVTGQTITKSFEDLSLAVGRQSKMILDNLGIMLDVEKANADYAASLGKTASELNDAERKQAFLNATMAAGQKIIDDVGVSTENASERLQRMQANLKNLKETGGRFLLAFGLAAWGIFQEMAAAWDWLIGRIIQVQAALLSVATKLPFVGEKAKELYEHLKTMSDGLMQTGDRLSGEGNSSLKSALDVITGKAGEATTAMQAAAEAGENVAEQAEAQAKALDSAASALGNYARSLGDVGKEQLRFAEAGFGKDLERQTEYLEKNNRLASNLGQPLRNYLNLVGQVYGAQLTAQQRVAETLKDLDADQSTRLQQQLTIANTEKALAETRLKAWGAYYDKLSAMHASAMEKMKQKQDQLLAVRKFGEDIGKAIEEKFHPAKALDPYEQFFADLGRIDSDSAAAMKLSGEKKIAALQAVMNRLKELPNQVADGNIVLVSQDEVYSQITKRIKAMQKASEEAAQAEVTAAQTTADALQAEMDRARQAMDALEGQVVALGDKIAALSQTIALSAVDQASGTVEKIKNAIDSLQDKTVTVSVNYVSTIPGSGAPSPTVGSQISSTGFASGTRYVPRTGYYQLHRGEEIRTRGEATGESQAGTNVTIQGGLNVSLPNVTNDSTARDLARELWPELQKLGQRVRKAS